MRRELTDRQFDSYEEEEPYSLDFMDSRNAAAFSCAWCGISV